MSNEPSMAVKEAARRIMGNAQWYKSEGYEDWMAGVIEHCTHHSGIVALLERLDCAMRKEPHGNFMGTCATIADDTRIFSINSKESAMTKEETLAKCREKWATLPTDGEALDWWGDIGCEQCALCDYVKSVYPDHGCDGICPFVSEYGCHPAREAIYTMSYKTWDYSIFKENFLLMQAAVNALKVEDLLD